MPVTHELSRTAAALGTALALIFLPFTGTIAPASAAPTTSAEVEASASTAGNTDSEAGASTDGTDNAGEGGSGKDEGADDKDPEEPGENDDGACDDSTKGGEADKPCTVTKPIEAEWNIVTHTLKLKTPNGEPGSMPRNWAGEPFEGPTKQEAKRWPVQNQSGTTHTSQTTTDGTESNAGTDDSGNPVPSTTAKAPDKYSLDDEGFVVDAANSDTPLEFERSPDPAWTFTSKDKKITVKGETYPPDPGDDAGKDAGATPGAKADRDAGSDAAEADGGDRDSSSNEDMSAGDDGTDSDTGSNNNSDSSDKKSNSDTSTNADGISSPKASSDSNSSDSAKADSKDADSSSSSDSDSAKKNSDSDSSSSSDGSDSDSGKSDSVGDADNDGSSNKDGGKDDKGSADKNGSGTTSSDGGPVGEDSTPDPETGNGSSDTRDEIPGDVGDDWMPGNEDSPPPDYSDPVPQNPDTPVPDDDKDLITGGNTPEPRSDKPPSTSFGESVVSTIVSSWPIFILAASGMAAVGFIIWLVGRRNNQS